MGKTKDADIGDNSEIEVDYDQLEQFLDSLSNKQKTVSEATGTLRSTLKQILDDTGWNKGALAYIRKVEAMSETARADYLRSEIPLREAMMEFKWSAELSDDLFDGDE